METEGSQQNLQQPATGLYSDRNVDSLRTFVRILIYSLMLSPNLT